MWKFAVALIQPYVGSATQGDGTVHKSGSVTVGGEKLPSPNTSPCERSVVKAVPGTAGFVGGLPLTDNSRLNVTPLNSMRVGCIVNGRLENSGSVRLENINRGAKRSTGTIGLLLMVGSEGNGLEAKDPLTS